MYQIFKLLCQKNNVTPYHVSKDTGISQATLSDWKRGVSTPKVDKLQKIADYFNVTIEYLMKGEEKDFSADNNEMNKEITEITKQLFNNNELRELFNIAKDASYDDLKTINEVLMALKKKEKNNYV